ncbi:phosphoglycerate mutase-like protein [Myriangium duriaei CBS 260.36]|uniref:3-phytase n=1 Tax=Myriangium duriaei CBS 260.36 TaxID=1168546 RepID=A0A9P4J366_9PEZI|nr:phosphoglycerate mutase-like protein [Myriangium duriaei CBS 260.36]
MLWKSFVFSSCATCALSAAVDKRQTATPTSSSSGVPQYLQTSPELYAGPTATGPAPFLAETNPAPFPGVSYIPVSPLETQVPIVGNTNNSNIFQLFGQLSHYFPNPSGFGVNEYPLPQGTNITWLNMLHRHGSRYPTSGSGAYSFGQKAKNLTGTANFTGELSFLNSWSFKLGAEILVPVGKQELFDSGTLHYYQYGHLYNNNGSKIVVRSTTQDRMTQSAEYFLAGFFGLTWTKNATLVLGIELDAGGLWNNSLAGYDNCNNSNTAVSSQGSTATTQWENIYLANATQRLHALAPGFNWTVTDSYNAQSLCAYETVAFGYSQFCSLFTYEEWEGYEYSVDINFAGNDAFQSPTGRAVGIGYVQEVLARLQHHLITKPTAQVNTTLDGMPSTFPLNQSLYFDFSHDTNIMSILTAFGFKQFAPVLPATHIVTRDLIVSHMEPFAARLDIEVIQAPHPVCANRSTVPVYEAGGATSYIHFILNQRTLPLHKSFPQCPYRDDGWCELSTFIGVLNNTLAEAEYNYSCFGNYSVVPYGTLTNGVPLGSST